MLPIPTTLEDWKAAAQWYWANYLSHNDAQPTDGCTVTLGGDGFPSFIFAAGEWHLYGPEDQDEVMRRSKKLWEGHQCPPYHHAVAAEYMREKLRR